MPEITDIRDGLEAAIDNISGLQVHDYVPDGTVVTPSASIRFDGRERASAQGHQRYFFTILLRLFGANEQELQKEMDKYLSVTGTESIEAALDADLTLGAVADYAVIRDQAFSIEEREPVENGWVWTVEIPIEVMSNG